MSLFTICNECGKQFKKWSIKSNPVMCFECKNWRKHDRAESRRKGIHRTIPQVIKEGEIMIERAKKFEAFIEKMDEDYLSSLIDERLNRMVDEKFEKIKMLTSILNNRIIELTKRIDKQVKEYVMDRKV
jgi:predicted transcriptional regulator